MFVPRLFIVLPALTLGQFDSPACTNMTGWWCCQATNLTQSGSVISTVGPEYGNGTGTLQGSELSMQFTNQPPGVLLNGTVSADCSSVAWDSGGAWTRMLNPPWAKPAVPAPDWAYGLSILEVNALAYTSPNGTGPLGDGSGTWLSLVSKVPYWQSLGIHGIWLAYFSMSTAHFYGIRSVYGCLDPAQVTAGISLHCVAHEHTPLFTHLCSLSPRSGLRATSRHLSMRATLLGSKCFWCVEEKTVAHVSSSPVCREPCLLLCVVCAGCHRPRAGEPVVVRNCSP
jgi:hypothetical protein